MLSWVLAAGGLIVIVAGMYYSIGSIGGSIRRFVVGGLTALAGFALLIAGINGILTEDAQYVCVEVTE